jgi:hypothetical protein
MDAGNFVANARLSLLARAEELRNVMAACREAGMSRSSYYQIKARFQIHGPDGLAPTPPRKPRMPNQTPPELEEQVLAMTARHPTDSYLAISIRLRLAGIDLTPSAVRGVWRRLGLLRSSHRVVWREQTAMGFGGMHSATGLADGITLQEHVEAFLRHPAEQPTPRAEGRAT